MAHPRRSDETLAEPAGERTADDDRWLWVAVGVGVAVYLTYLVVYAYPIHGAGLYVEMAHQIQLHGYRLPRTVPYYTEAGIPFAYPPLLFYLLAGLRDATGVGPFALARFLPGLFTVAYLVPYYYLAAELLGSRRQTGVATAIVAVAPPLLRWHLAAGGVVRAPAFLFALSGLYAGVRLFEGGDRMWVIPATALFALTLLSHPVYATVLGIGTLLLYGYFDRSVEGLCYGAAVAIGGVVLTAPWWMQVVSAHGVSTFGAAAGTHDGLGGGLTRLYDSFVVPLFPDGDAPFFAVIYAGAVYLAARRRYFLPAWLGATGYLFRQERLLFVPGAMAAAVFLVDVAAPAGRRLARTVTRRQALSAVLVVAVGVSAVGGLVVSPGVAAGSAGLERSLPAPYADRHDEAATTWASRETATDARFVVLGDAAEWFPALTHRTSLVSPWGVEWRGDRQFENQKDLFDSLSACHSAACLSAGLDAAGLHPDYVYVPKGRYTIRRDEAVQSPEMRRTLVESPRYRLVYENGGVMVFRTTDEWPAAERGELEASPREGAVAR